MFYLKFQDFYKNLEQLILLESGNIEFYLSVMRNLLMMLPEHHETYILLTEVFQQKYFHSELITSKTIKEIQLIKRKKELKKNL